MIGAFAKRLFGSANDRVIKSLQKTVDAVNALEPEVERLSDAELGMHRVLDGRREIYEQRFAQWSADDLERLARELARYNATWAD